MRTCNCSGTCQPEASDLTRREFIGLVGGSTAALLAGPAFGAFEPLVEVQAGQSLSAELSL